AVTFCASAFALPIALLALAAAFLAAFFAAFSSAFTVTVGPLFLLALLGALAFAFFAEVAFALALPAGLACAFLAADADAFGLTCLDRVVDTCFDGLVPPGARWGGPESEPTPPLGLRLAESGRTRPSARPATHPHRP